MTVPVHRPSTRMDEIVPAGTELVLLGEGYVAAEGPVWLLEEDALLFSDFRASKRYRWTAREGVVLLVDGTDEGNGMTRDSAGRLYVCERATARVTRWDADGAFAVVSDRWHGHRLNAPNDVVVSRGDVAWFSDPISPDYESPRGYPALFRQAPGEVEPTLVTRELLFPNGLAFSPDESTLYVADTKRMALYTVRTGPVEELPDDRPELFFRFDAGHGPGQPDGLKVDVEGNVYSTGPGGIWVIAPSGELLGVIETGDHHLTNLAWGGPDWRTLFITARGALLRLDMGIPGLPVPTPPIS